jgi:hypothetical protein
VVAQNDARELGPQHGLDHGGPDARVLAQKRELLGRQIRLAIQAVVIEESQAAVVNEPAIRAVSTSAGVIAR